MSSVDVIVPCYNYAKYLRKCVQSVLTQEGVDVRVLVIDDASPDSTPAIAEELVRCDSRVSYRRHERNLGHIATYNEGIDWVSAEFYLLLSADDMLAAKALARAIGALSRHPEAAMCHGDAHVIRGDADPDLQAEINLEAILEISITGMDFIESCCLDSANNPVWSPTAIIRTSTQKTVGHYNAKFPHSADLEMWIRLAQHGSILRIPAVQAFYRRHEKNMHTAYLGVRNLEEHLLTFNSALVVGSYGCKDLDRLRTLYRRGLALGAIKAANNALNNRDDYSYRQAVEFIDRVYQRIRRTRFWYETMLRKAIGYNILTKARVFLGPMYRKLH